MRRGHNDFTMTRINTIDPRVLLDQHLFAEYRELPRAVHTAKPYRKDIPPSYRMGKGHVLFFADKTEWLVNRHRALVEELVLRGYKLSNVAPLVAKESTAWCPSATDHTTNLARLQDRLDARPGWYRLRGELVPVAYYANLHHHVL